MGKKHQDGAKTGKKDQPPGRRRGPETGTGFTGGSRGRVDEVANSDASSARADGSHRVFGFLWTRRAK
jgi:hypothetical protein